MYKNSLFSKGLIFEILVMFVVMSIIPITLGTNEKTIDVTDDGLQLLTTNRDGNTLYVGGSGPSNYSRIQAAIDDASDNDTVFVYAYSSPYYENIVVNKFINLIGENRDTTIIDGNSSGIVVHISADEVNINGFTIQNGSHGLVMQYTSHCNISSNLIANNSENGIYLDYAPQSSFYDNIIRNNNESGITIFSIYWSSYMNNIQRNTIINNGYGIFLFFTSQDTITQNIIANNNQGIHCENPDNITVYHNNFINNTKHAIINNGYNSHWDNGYPSGGNYWDDYNGIDNFHGPGQNISGIDGIGDTPYNFSGIDPYLKDNYPFMVENGWLYTCGDVNGDGSISPADGFHILNYLGGGLPPVSTWAANVNGVHGITPSDAFYLLLFLGGGYDLNCQPCNE